jgi:hypothetical protein
MTGHRWTDANSISIEPDGSDTAATIGDEGAGSAAIVTGLNVAGTCARSQSC